MNKDLYSISFSLFCLMTFSVHGQFKTPNNEYLEGAVTAEFSDIDKDGYPDLILGTRAGIRFVLNKDGKINVNDHYGLNSNDEVIHLMDIDSDGLTDIVSGSSTDPGIRWFQNAGAGQFVGPLQLVSEGLVKHLVSGDINNDDRLDLIANTNDMGLVAFIQDFNGEYAEPIVLTPNTAERAPRLADMDDDGDMDLIWDMDDASYLSENLDGYGNMAPEVTLSESGWSLLADLDGDGKSDMVRIDPDLRAIVWQKRLGTMNTFAEDKVITPGVQKGGSLHALDLDADGDNDLVFTSMAFDEIRWMENGNGRADFGEPELIANELIDPAFVAFADMDADGDMDVVSASEEAMSFSFIETDLQFQDMVVGRVFNDLDFDGKFSAGDHGIAGQPVGLSDGRTTYTDHNGTYMFPVASGSYVVSIQGNDQWDLTTDGYSKQVVLSAQHGSSLGNDFGFASVSTDGSVRGTLSSGQTRCGMVIPYWITVRNLSAVQAEISATLTLGEGETFVWAGTTPTFQSEDKISWELGPFHASEERIIPVYVAMPTSDKQGDRLTDLLEVRAIVDGRTVEMTDSLNRQLNCAPIANSITISPEGHGAEQAISWSQELTYTASIENVTGDLVKHVLVEDTLDEWLDPSTFEVLASSHDHRVYIDAEGVIRFYLENVQLQDSWKDPLRSQAFVKYRIRPLSWVPNGEYITNNATYFFDVNEPVSTNTLRNKVGKSISLGAQKWEALSETNIVYPNPTNGPTTFDLTSYKYDRVEIHLIDASGRVIFKREMRGGQKHFFQLGALGKGNYLVRALPLETGEAELLTKLVVR